MVSKFRITTIACLLFLNASLQAQDSLFLWGGTTKAVRIAGFEKNKIMYYGLKNQNTPMYIHLSKVMDLHCADTSKDWVSQIRPETDFGQLPIRPEGIDSLALAHVKTYYLGGRKSGKSVFVTTILGTPALGLIQAGIESSFKNTEQNSGMMGNPHKNNTDYTKRYLSYAKKERLNRIWLNYAGGTLLFALPLAVIIMSVQSMSVGLSF